MSAIQLSGDPAARRLERFHSGYARAVSYPVSVKNTFVAGSEDLSQSLEARVQEFTLSNGLHFIVLERSIAPIVSCHTYADVGAFDEVDGQTGAYAYLPLQTFVGFFVFMHA